MGKPHVKVPNDITVIPKSVEKVRKTRSATNDWITMTHFFHPRRGMRGSN